MCARSPESKLDARLAERKPEVAEAETGLLSVAPAGADSRLGCDVIVTDFGAGVIGPGVFGVAGAVDDVGEPNPSSYIESYEDWPIFFY